MTQNIIELKSKLIDANSMDEVKSILRESGEDESQAEQIWKEVCARRESEELSTDELAAVSGGADRDWLTDGCAATVEPGSWCGSNDACSIWSVTYSHEPTSNKCPRCGGFLYVVRTSYGTNPSDDEALLKCRNCDYQQWY